MLRLMLVRHGETDWNKSNRYLGSTDLDLNATGFRQAGAIANYLEPENPEMIFTSGLNRAVQTSDTIAKLLKLTPRVDDRLREISFGLFEGLTFAEAKIAHPIMLSNWMEDYDQPPQGGESLTQLSQRIEEFLGMVKVLEKPKCVVVVSHGGPLREITRQLLGMPQPTHWYFSFMPGSVSEIKLYSSGPVIKYLNLIPENAG